MKNLKYLLAALLLGFCAPAYADTKISAMSACSTLTGTEVTPLVQSGANCKQTLSGLQSFIGAGTVTSVSVGTANGFSGFVNTATSTPQLLLSTTAAGILYGSSGTVAGATVGTGLTFSTGTLSNNAESFLTYERGKFTSVTSAFTSFYKVPKASTVDNIIGSSDGLTCTTNPTITVYECGTSTTCASSPVTIGTVTVTAGGTAFAGTVSSAAITAGDYVAFAITAGACTSLDFSITAGIHAN